MKALKASVWATVSVSLPSVTVVFLSFMTWDANTQVEYTGELPFGIGGKDVILYTMGKYEAKRA